MRHVQIEQDQVRPVLDVQRRGLARVVRALDPRESRARQDALENLDVRVLVVDDEDTGVSELPRGHRTPAGDRFAIASAAGDSGHSIGGAAVYAACASRAWKSAVSEA